LQPSNSSLDRHPAYVHRFYKEGASLQTATPIDVAPGQTESVLIPLESDRRYRIRGQVACADPNSSSIHLRLEDDRIPLVLPTWDFQTRAFTFTNVPPGTYVLEANCNNGRGALDTGDHLGFRSRRRRIIYGRSVTCLVRLPVRWTVTGVLRRAVNVRRLPNHAEI
jgi:hypothetical protein